MIVIRKKGHTLPNPKSIGLSHYDLGLDYSDVQIKRFMQMLG